jgi:TonB family protein
LTGVSDFIVNPDHVTHVVDARWGDLRSDSPYFFFWTLATAFLVHILAFWIMIGGLEGLLPGTFSARDRGREQHVGDAKGAVDGIAAEVIAAEEFEKRFISFDAGKDAADVKSQPNTPPPEAEQKPKEKASQSKELTPDAPGFEQGPSQPKPKESQASNERQLSDDEIAEIMAMTSQQMQGVAAALSKPSQARLGETSPFVRGVIRILKQTMPQLVRKKGVVVVRFIVSDQGMAEAIQVVRSSGQPDLDQVVLQQIQSTRLLVPTKETSELDRLFQITYEYE